MKNNQCDMCGKFFNSPTKTYNFVEGGKLCCNSCWTFQSLKDKGAEEKINTKCLICGTNIFSNTQVYCTNCQLDEYGMAYPNEQDTINAYEEVSGFDSQIGCDYCGVNNYKFLWEHEKNCIYYRPEPKNKQSIDCKCGGQSFMDNPQLHHPQCPVYLYYGMQKSIPQSDDFQEAFKKFTASQEKQLQQIANKIALDQYLKKGIDLPKELKWSGIIPEPKKEIEIEEVETIEKPKKRKINLD